MSELARAGVRIGTSSWKYPGWCGQVYDEQRYLRREKFSVAKFERECLAEYTETFKPALGELIDRLQKENIQVIQCTLTSVGEKHDGTNKDDPKLDEFAEIQRQVSKAKNVPFNDLCRAVVAHWKAHNPENKDSRILTYDGNHFNDAGMTFVAEQMLVRFR